MSIHGPVYSTIDRCGIEIEIEITVNVITWGESQTYDDPGSGPEWEPDKIVTLHARISLDYNTDLTDDERKAVDDAVEDNLGDWESDAAEDYYEWRCGLAYG